MVPGQGYRIKMLAADTLIYLPNTIPFACGSPIADYDGNIYNTIQIGTQCWMKENLKTTHYADGTAIPLVTSNSAWDALGDTAKAYCFYNNSASYGATYGALYTCAGAMDGADSSNTVPSGVQGVCPAGWHVPSDEEWKILEGTVDSQYGYPNSVWNDMAGRGFDAGLNLKTYYGNGYDLYGFSALLGGFRFSDNGEFTGYGYHGLWWSSSSDNDSNCLGRDLYYYDDYVWRYYYGTDYGLSVRCLRD